MDGDVCRPRHQRRLGLGKKGRGAQREQREETSEHVYFVKDNPGLLTITCGLQFEQLGVFAAERDELLMGPMFHDASLFQY